MTDCCKRLHRIVANYSTTILVFIVCLLGCSTVDKKQDELNVFAAISLTDALTEISAEFNKDNKIRVYLNFAASTTLQRQIEKGASADIFISASSKQIDDLNILNLLEDNSRSDILVNNLVVVSEKNSDIQLDTVDQLQNPLISRIAIGQPEIVPAGTYAKETLIHYDLWTKLKPKLIFGNDVRATLAYVTAGNVDLAIVYGTDSKLNNNVKVVLRIPDETYTPIVYPAVILKSSMRKQLAKQFIVYLKTYGATAIFEKHGFTGLSHTSVPQRVPDTLQ